MGKNLSKTSNEGDWRYRDAYDYIQIHNKWSNGINALWPSDSIMVTSMWVDLYQVMA